MWGYEGQFPRPVIEAERSECVHVKWIYELPEEHFLPIDHSIHSSSEDMPHVRTVVHLHGRKLNPPATGTRRHGSQGDSSEPALVLSMSIYRYPNSQRATALWYNDHAIGITRLNVYAGLAGMYLIRDDHEKMLNLPAGNYGQVIQ